MTELVFPPSGRTVLYEDNAAAIKIINAQQPTERLRHVRLSLFAIQDWRKMGFIVMKHIPSNINPSDDLTKPLGWVLHSRHALRLMGYYT